MGRLIRRIAPLLLLLMVSGAGDARPDGSSAALAKSAPPPTVRDQPTKLIRRGPSPARWPEPDPPAGVERVEYRSGDLPLAAWLAVPADRAPDARLPAVVYLHGWFGLRPEVWKDARRFVERGFVVLVPMLRGENGNPGHFEMFYGELDDAAAAVRWLAARPEVDARQVYAFGHSVGGNLAGLLSLVPDLPLVSTASAGGVYTADVFDSWRRVVPFPRHDGAEVQARLLHPNLDRMQRPHHAYVGDQDGILRYAREVARAARESDAPFDLDVVEGDHFSAVRPAIDRFIDGLALARSGAARAPRSPAPRRSSATTPR
jgi:acetyl esterase/lipase